MSKYLCFILMVTVFACKQESYKMQDDFTTLLQNYNEDRMWFFPFESTMAGETKWNHHLPNKLTSASKDSLKAMYGKYYLALKNYDPSKLQGEEAISYEILKWECEVNLDEEDLDERLLPLNQFESLHLTMGTYASGEGAQPFKTVKDYDNWLERLISYSSWLDTAEVRMKEGIRKGIVLPKELTVKLIPQFDEMTHKDVSAHLFYSPIKKLPENFTTEDKNRLTAAYVDVIKNKLLPRFDKMTAFLKNEYLTASRTSAGIGELPGGKTYYAAKLKEQTTTYLSAEEIHHLGLKEVARLRIEMEKVINQVGFKGDLRTFFDYVRNKKELMPFTSPQQVIDNFNSIHNTMKPHLAMLFDLTPKTLFEVRRTEAFREASASAEYIQGSIDGSRPGIFYVPIADVKKYNYYSDEDLFLHEAIPGHHYQISLQQENSMLPQFRKILWYGAYGEGWALYAESLGKELGLYKDPYQYFGMLSAEMHRSIRLVVDTGIHAKGWSREKAIAYSLDNEAEAEASIVSEVERYMAWPGQACGYKIGQLKIMELKNNMQKKLGSKFDIKKFHNQVLESGCLPLAVLETKLLSAHQ